MGAEYWSKHQTKKSFVVYIDAENMETFLEGWSELGVKSLTKPTIEKVQSYIEQTYDVILRIIYQVVITEEYPYTEQEPGEGWVVINDRLGKLK